MILSEKYGNYTKSLLGDKILTTRLKLPAHIAKGKVWAIVPARAYPAWWIGSDSIVPDSRDYVAKVYYPLWRIPVPDIWVRQQMSDDGFIRAAVTIDDFYSEPLQDMDRHKAYADGFKSVEDFRVVWDALNPRVKWETNPTIWRVWYHTPMDVHDAVIRVGHEAIVAAGEVWRAAHGKVYTSFRSQ